MKVFPGTRFSLARRVAAVAAVVPLLLTAAACGGGSDTFQSGGGGGGKGQVVIAGQDYTEMKIMSAMYAALLEQAGYSTTIKTVTTRDVYGPSLSSGKVDVVADYASSMTEYLNLAINGPDAPPAASPDIKKTMAALEKLGKQKGITPLKPAKAQDANAFAVTKKFSQANHVTTTSQLAARGKPIVLAAAPDCPQREDCKLGLEKVYGLKISKFEPLGFGTVQTKDALKSGEVNLGQVGTSDGSLKQNGLVVLQDDKHLQNAENLVPVVNTKFLDKHQDLRGILDKLSGVLTTEDLKTLNAKVDVQRQLPEDVAKQYLQQKGLL
jgi:osmoprotectant transport system substrate-binding protein